MPFLSSLQRQYDKYLEVNGEPVGPAPAWNPTYIPEPRVRRSWRERREDLIVLVQALAMMARR